MSNDRNELSELLGERLADVATGSADLVLALVAALKQQPGIDAQKLVNDFADAIPDRYEAAGGQIHRAVKSILRQQ